MTEIIKELESFYAEDPQLGDILFIKNDFEDVSLRGEVVGLERHIPHRGLNPDKTYEVVIYHGLLIKLAGIDQWFDTDEWTVTDKLSGWEYKKLPPEVVAQRIEEEN